MKVQLKSKLGLVLGIPSLMLGLLMLNYYSFGTINFLMAIILLIFGLSGFLWFRFGQLVNLYLLINCLVLIYLAIETFFYFEQPYNSYSGFNKAAAKYDANIGYRWVEDEVRYFKYFNGQTIFDNKFKLNEQQKVATFNYQFKKNDSIKRYLLFGDSFMEGLMLEENIPNRINRLNHQQEKQTFELYSFAMDGSGVLNWEAEFFSEVISQYEFDGIIVASYMDNLYRDYMVMHLQPNISYIGRLDNLPPHLDFESFPNHKFQIEDFVFTDQQINTFKQKPKKNFEWSFKKYVLRYLKRVGQNSRGKATKVVNNIEELKLKMGSKKWEAFASIVNYCDQNKKSIILASVPSRQLLKEKKEDPNFHEMDMRLIAAHYNLLYFNGYEVFDKLSNMEIDSLWLEHDGHWNQDGSNLYAKALHQYLNEFTVKK